MEARPAQRVRSQHLQPDRVQVLVHGLLAVAASKQVASLLILGARPPLGKVHGELEGGQVVSLLHFDLPLADLLAKDGERLIGNGVASVEV